MRWIAALMAFGLALPAVAANQDAVASQTAAAQGTRPVALFYMTNDPNSIRDFFAHSSQIDLLVPTWYQVDENGLVTGAPEPAVLAQAKSDADCRFV
jgi:spore germination protein YaaH